MIRFILLLFFLNFSVWSADLHLYNADEVFNDNFSESIFSGNLKSGEVIHLLDRSVTYRGILGSGNTTLILRVYDEEIGTEMALRLPHGNQENNYDINDAKRFINHTYNGFSELNDSKLPIPQVHSYEKSSYLLVDLIENDFDLKDFISNSDSIEDSQKSHIVNSLVDFARQSAIFQSIGDFHLEQLVYSKTKMKWFLLDWSSGHELARLASSSTIFNDHLFTDSKRVPTEFEKEILELLSDAIREERTKRSEIDTIEVEKIKLALSEITDHREILKVYNKIKTQHLLSFYTLLQKDFIANHLSKFPEGAIRKAELELLLKHLGKFSPFYFSQFAEKIIGSLDDLETFMFLYKKMNEIGLDEEVEDDISIIIAKNMKRILSRTVDGPKIRNIVEKLSNDYGLINYQAKEILVNATELLIPPQSCKEVLAKILDVD